MTSVLYPCFSHVEIVNARVHNPLQRGEGGEDK